MVEYKRTDLVSMTVKQIQALVRKHNLHTNYIKNYSRLRKDALIDKFLEHYKKAVKMNEPMVRTQEA